MEAARLPIGPDEAAQAAFRSAVEIKDFMVYKCSAYEEWDGMNGFGRRSCVEAVCTACGETRYYDKVTRAGCKGGRHIGFLDEWDGCEIERFSGDVMVCRSCGEEVQAIHVSEFGHAEWIARQAGVMGCVRRVDGEAVLLFWHVERQFNKAGQVRWQYDRYEAYWPEEKVDKRGRRRVKLVKAVGYQKFMGGFCVLDKWRRSARCQTTVGHLIDYCEPFPPEVLAGTMLEKSGLEAYAAHEWMYADRYLDTWCHHPAVENIARTYPWLCYQIMKDSEAEYQAYYYNVRSVGSHEGAGLLDWKKVRPHEMLRLSRADARRAEAGRWSAEKLRIYKRIRETVGEELPDEMLNRIGGNGLTIYVLDKLLARKVSVMRAIRYADRQAGTGLQSKLSDLCDVWRMMEERGAVLDASALWPRDLMRTHEREVTLAAERKHLLDTADEERLSRMIGERYEKYRRLGWSAKGLYIVPARDVAELVAEGNHNHNCVGTYTKAVAGGTTTIWFIRRVEEPQEPFFTLELDPQDLQTVRQNRGMRNCDATAEINAFTAAWLDHVQIKNKELRINGK